MSSNVIIGLIIAVIFLYYINKKNPKKDSLAKQKEFAKIFYDFILERKKEIFTNVMDNRSMWRLELEAATLIIEAKKMNLFPLEILKKLVPYTHLEMYLDLENEIAKKEIVELEKYFFNFLN